MARREKVRRLIERNTRVIISFRSRAVYIWVYDGTGRGSSRFAHSPRNLEPVGITSDRSRSRGRRSWQRRRLAELLAELLQQVIVRKLGLGGVGEGHLQLLEAALDDDGVAPRDALVPGRGRLRRGSELDDVRDEDAVLARAPLPRRRRVGSDAVPLLHARVLAARPKLLGDGLPVDVVQQPEVLAALGGPAARLRSLRGEPLGHVLREFANLLRGPVSLLRTVLEHPPLVAARLSRSLKLLADFVPLLPHFPDQGQERLLLLFAPLPLVVVRIVVSRDEGVHLLGIARGEPVSDLEESLSLARGQPRAAAALLRPPVEEVIVLLRLEIRAVAVRVRPVLDARVHLILFLRAPLAELLPLELPVPPIVVSLSLDEISSPIANRSHGQFFAHLLPLRRLRRARVVVYRNEIILHDGGSGDDLLLQVAPHRADRVPVIPAVLLRGIGRSISRRGLLPHHRAGQRCSDARAASVGSSPVDDERKRVDTRRSRLMRVELPARENSAPLLSTRNFDRFPRGRKKGRSKT